MLEIVPPKDPIINEIPISSSPQTFSKPSLLKNKILLDKQDATFFEEKSNFEKVFLKIKAKKEDCENPGNNLSPNINGRHHLFRTSATFDIEKDGDNEMNQRKNRISLTNTFKLNAFNSRMKDMETNENNKINETTSNFLFLNKINRKPHDDGDFRFFKNFYYQVGQSPGNKFKEESKKVFLSLPKPDAKNLEKKELISPKQLYNEIGIYIF